MRVTQSFFMLLVLSGAGLFTARAQVQEASRGSQPHLWVGVEGSDFNADYNPLGGRLIGVGIYGDYLLTRHVGLEGQVRLLDLNKPNGQTQKSFLAGPIIDAYRYHRFTVYGKVLAGAATVNYPYDIGYGSYFAFGAGGGVEYRLNARFKLRGEYEYDFLPSAPGKEITGIFPSTGLSPNGFSGGISYRIF